MAHSRFSSKIRSVVFCILSFILSMILFALSVFITLDTTVLSSEFIFEKMNSNNYFLDKCDEITQDLTDLGYASGLDESFFDGLVTEVMVNSDTQTYLENYYSGNGTVIDTTDFKQIFNDALDEYIEENNIENVVGSSRDYLVTKASNIYKDSLEIPLFSRLSSYLLKAKSLMPIAIAILGAAAAAIILVLIFTNKWKHRAMKYCCYAFSGAFLSVGIIPAYLLISGIISKINLTSRALYNMVVSAGNSIIISLAVCAAIFLVMAIVLFFGHKIKRDKLMK